MSLLLIQFEYMTAKAKQTTLEAKVTRLNDLHERYTKRIETISNIFAKKEKSIESDFSKAQSAFSANVNNSLLGLGVTTATATNTTATLATALPVTAEFMGHIFNITCEAGTPIASVASKMTSILQQYLEAAKELELAKLEQAKQDQLDPIQEKDIDIDLKKSGAEAMLEIVDARVDKAKTRLQKVAPESVAGYGLK